MHTCPLRTPRAFQPRLHFIAPALLLRARSCDAARAGRYVPGRTSRLNSARHVSVRLGPITRNVKQRMRSLPPPLGQ